MTTHRDPDRTIRAWLDQMPDEAPYRTVAAVLQAVETTPQVRPRSLGGRWRIPPMTRFSILAATAVVVVAAGGIYLLASRPPVDAGPVGVPSASPPSSTPAPSTAPTPTPAPTAAPIPTPVPTAAVVPLDAQLRSMWVADVTSIDGLDHEPRVALAIGSGGRDMALETNGFGNTTLSSVPVEATDTELRLVTDRAGAGCDVGDEGRYGWTLSDDGSLLTLDPITDACATRAAAFGRTWARSLAGTSVGGRGALPVFDPAVLVTLPDAPFGGDTTRDAIEVSSIIEQAGLYAVKNPWGMTEPCGPEGSQVLPVDEGVDPFVAYLRTLPGVTVDTTRMKIGGYRAVNVVLTSSADVACPAGVITAWTAKNVTSGWRWHLDPGATASIFVVEHPQATFVFEYGGESVTAADARAVMSSIEFAAALPPTP